MTDTKSPAPQPETTPATQPMPQPRWVFDGLSGFRGRLETDFKIVYQRPPRKK